MPTQQQEEMGRAQIIKHLMFKNGLKQSVLYLIVIPSQDEVFKFLDQLSRDCIIIQVVPVSHNPWEEAVFVHIYLCPLHTRNRIEKDVLNVPLEGPTGCIKNMAGYRVLLA